MAKDKKSTPGESEVFTQGFRAAENGSDVTANPLLASLLRKFGASARAIRSGVTLVHR